MDASGRSEASFWACTLAEIRRVIRSGRRRTRIERAVHYRQSAYAARLGQSSDRNIDRHLPDLGGDEEEHQLPDWEE